jgi:vitamin B12 transporter
MHSACLKFLFILGLSPALATSALAGEPAAGSADTIVISATRTDQRLALTGQSVAVITAQDLADGQQLLVSDALAQTPGLSVVRNGGIGQTTSIGIRGAPSGQTLVLVDGVRINDPSAPDGSAILADLLVSNLARIEVLRGPQSTLYGSDAIGGVVNLISRRAGTGPCNLSGSAEGGSLSTLRGNLAACGSAGTLDYSAALNAYRTDGVSAADVRNGNSEADGYRNLGASTNLRWHASDNLSLDLRGYYVEARADFDGYPPPNYTFQDTPEYGKDRLFAAYLGANFSSFGGRFSQRLAVTDSFSDRKNFDPTQTVSEDFYSRGEAQRLEYQGVVDTGAGDQLSFGAETQRTRLKTASPNSFDPDPVPVRGVTRIDGFYVQYQATVWQALTLTGGVRSDRDADYGEHTSLKLAAAWQLPGGNTVVRANYGDGFKAPTLYELFSPYSNPVATLRPESAQGWEVGVDQQALGGRLRFGLSWFERRTHDQIDFYSCFGVTSPACAVRPFGYYDNVERSYAEGAELQWSLRLAAALSLQGNFTRLKAIDELSGLDLARRPRSAGSLGLQWRPTAGWSLGAAALYTGARFDDPFESTPLPGYTLLSLLASHEFTPHCSVYARVENLADRQYEPVAGYGAAGRTFALGVRAGL